MNEPEITNYGSGLFKKDAIDSDYNYTSINNGSPSQNKTAP